MIGNENEGGVEKWNGDSQPRVSLQMRQGVRKKNLMNKLGIRFSKLEEV